MSAVRSRISSKLIFAGCVGYFDRVYYGFIYHIPGTVPDDVSLWFWKKKKLPTADLANSRQTVSLRHTASDTVRPALLMGGRRGSPVDIAVVVPGTST